MECRHHLCRGMKEGGNPTFACNSSRNKHERRLGPHPCNPSTCTRCAELQDKRTGQAANRPFYCRHQKACGRSYADENSRCSHELHVVHCCEESCQRCKAARTAPSKKRKQRAEEDKQAQRELLQQRKAKCQRAMAAIAAVDWDAHLEQTLHLPESEVVRGQAELLLARLMGGNTLEECLLQLVAEHLPLMRYLTQNLPISFIATLLQEQTRASLLSPALVLSSSSSSAPPPPTNNESSFRFKFTSVYPSTSASSSPTSTSFSASSSPTASSSSSSPSSSSSSSSSASSSSLSH